MKSAVHVRHFKYHLNNWSFGYSELYYIVLNIYVSEFLLIYKIITTLPRILIGWDFVAEIKGSNEILVESGKRIGTVFAQVILIVDLKHTLHKIKHQSRTNILRLKTRHVYVQRHFQIYDLGYKDGHSSNITSLQERDENITFGARKTSCSTEEDSGIWFCPVKVEFLQFII